MSAHETARQARALLRRALARHARTLDDIATAWRTIARGTASPAREEYEQAALAALRAANVLDEHVARSPEPEVQT